MSLLLFGDNNKPVKTASQIIRETIGFEKVNDVWHIVFSTIQDRKGYGRQRVPVQEFSAFVEVLQNAVNNGIHREDEELSCSEVVRKSLIQSEGGSIRFKTESTKGKKPTLFVNQDDFAAGVNMLASVAEMVQEKSKSLK